jgi:hypothetical protein
MAFRLVTCPDSGHLELIEFDDHPLGLLIRDCSAMHACPFDCPRTCAARLDRKERLDPWPDFSDETTTVDVFAPIRQRVMV